VPIHFKALQNFTKIELLGLIERAIELKKERKTGIIDRQLAGKPVGLFLEKPSTRTRVSFESAIYAGAKKWPKKCWSLNDVQSLTRRKIRCIFKRLFWRVLLFDDVVKKLYRSTT
jgi:aspartate carbamoyltransferase catalytic subunit